MLTRLQTTSTDHDGPQLRGGYVTISPLLPKTGKGPTSFSRLRDKFLHLREQVSCNRELDILQ